VIKSPGNNIPKTAMISECGDHPRNLTATLGGVYRQLSEYYEVGGSRSNPMDEKRAETRRKYL
jgi:hypothetical protein